MLNLPKGFSEYICNLTLGGHMSRLQSPCHKHVSNIMAIDSNVFGLFVKHRILSYMLSCFVVTMHCDREMYWNEKIHH